MFRYGFYSFLKLWFHKLTANIARFNESWALKDFEISVEPEELQKVIDANFRYIFENISEVIYKFDVDYVFTQVRAKSVGETTKILSACVKCNEENEVQINLEDIKMDAAELKTTVVPITDTISVKMKYPTYDDMLKNPNYLKTDASQTELLFESMISCMHSVQSGDDNIIISQEPREEIEKFVNSLTNQQLEKITQFVQSMPTMKHEQKFTCKKCQHENTVELKGLQDFF